MYYMSCAVLGAWDVTDYIGGMPNLMKTICLSSIVYCSPEAIEGIEVNATRTTKHNYLKVKLSCRLGFPKKKIMVNS